MGRAGRRQILTIAAGAASLAAAGCTTSSAPGSSDVLVVGSPAAVQGCQYLTSVRGDQNLYGGILLSGAAYNDAVQQMKNQAAAAGGNRLYAAGGNTGMGGSNLTGDVYRC